MVPLHAALLAILLFVTEVLVVFGSKMVEVQQQGMIDSTVAVEAQVDTDLMFVSPNVVFVKAFVVAVIMVLTVTNSFAPYAAAGGHTYKLALYGAIMTFLSGLALLLVPLIVQGLFSTVAAPAG